MIQRVLTFTYQLFVTFLILFEFGGTFVSRTRLRKKSLYYETIFNKHGGDMIEAAQKGFICACYCMPRYNSLLQGQKCIIQDLINSTRLIRKVTKLCNEARKDYKHLRIYSYMPVQNLFHQTGQNFEDPNALTQTIEPHHHHAKIFLSEVRHQILIPTLRSYLKLYTTMGIDKLSAFLDIDAETLRTHGTLLEGEYVTTSDLDFCLKQDMIHIAESKVGRRYGDWFLRHINKFQDIIAGMDLRN
ncbi:unnamed protein product [Rhizophagus irregularis]|nr:unnamed protein product [Rhizophagus irregularis]